MGLSSCRMLRYPPTLLICRHLYQGKRQTGMAQWSSHLTPSLEFTKIASRKFPHHAYPVCIYPRAVLQLWLQPSIFFCYSFFLFLWYPKPLLSIIVILTSYFPYRWFSRHTKQGCAGILLPFKTSYIKWLSVFLIINFLSPLYPVKVSPTALILTESM